MNTQEEGEQGRMTLKVADISKKFNHVTAVDHLSFSIEKGKVLGLLGRNGAGKTTTIKMILGLLQQDHGEILWEDQQLRQTQIKIGYLPEERGLYSKTKVNEQLLYFGQLEGMRKSATQTSINQWLERLEISHYKDKRAVELSKGNQQKIQLIATLLHNPELIILDEPFSGLDPVNTKIMSEIIEEQIQMGKTIILSSHRMEQIEMFCQDICILKNGRKVLSGDLQQIKQNYGYQNLTLPYSNDIERKMRKLEIYFEKDGNELTMKVNDEKEAISILSSLSAQDLSFRYFKLLEPTLNDIFIEKVNG